MYTALWEKTYEVFLFFYYGILSLKSVIAKDLHKKLPWDFIYHRMKPLFGEKKQWSWILATDQVC